MNISRTVFHPILQCDTKYDAYYVASVPVRLHITKPGTDFDYTETYTCQDDGHFQVSFAERADGRV